MINAAYNIGCNRALTKLGGVGWDLHGYHSEPSMSEDAPPYPHKHEDIWDTTTTEKPYGDKPGFLASLFGKKQKTRTQTDRVLKPGMEAQRDAYREHYKKYDPWEVQRRARIQTPYDKLTNYKLNMNADWNSPLAGHGELEDYMSDDAYASEPYDRRLSREELTEFLGKYRPRAAAYQADLREKEPESEADVSAGLQAFRDKAKHILADPKFQFARLEYE